MKLKDSSRIKKAKQQPIVEKPKDMFSFLDQIFLADLRTQNPAPSPLDKFKEKQAPVTEASIQLHAQVRLICLLIKNANDLMVLDRPTS